MQEGELPELIETLERDARWEAYSLESRGKLPAGFSEQHYGLSPDDRFELARLRAALELATDFETWRDLRYGVPVEPSRLDKRALQQAQTASLVQLIRPIDLIHRTAV